MKFSSLHHLTLSFLYLYPSSLPSTSNSFPLPYTFPVTWSNQSTPPHTATTKIEKKKKKRHFFLVIPVLTEEFVYFHKILSSLVCHLFIFSNVRFTHPCLKRVKYLFWYVNTPVSFLFLFYYVSYTLRFYTSKTPYSDRITFLPFFRGRSRTNPIHYLSIMSQPIQHTLNILFVYNLNLTILFV